KLGLVGTIFTVGCCLGLPGFLPLAAAVGLGFMTNMTVVKPLLLVLLAVTVAGFVPGFRRHHAVYPLAASVAAAATIYWFMFVSYRPVFIQASVLVLVAASLFNLFLMRRKQRVCKS
ncbi:MerC domain-containing protein, partial [Acidobacteriia bacterium AH_259_A11_L15]|nr:MerC domain-containing protein [Acidobacteriia bacterium AH_259_A11_L15]